MSVFMSVYSGVPAQGAQVLWPSIVIYAYYCLYPSTHQSSLMGMPISDRSPGSMPVNGRVDCMDVPYLVNR